MKLILRLVLYWFGRRAKRGAVLEAKRRGVLFYLKAVNGTRRGLLLALLAFVTLQVMVLAFVGALVTGVFLLDADLQSKLWLLFALFGGLFVLLAGALAVLFSERFWFSASGARRMVEDFDR